MYISPNQSRLTEHNYKQWTFNPDKLDKPASEYNLNANAFSYEGKKDLFQERRRCIYKYGEYKLWGCAEKNENAVKYGSRGYVRGKGRGVES